MVRFEWHFFGSPSWSIVRDEGLVIGLCLLFVNVWLRIEGPAFPCRSFGAGREFRISIHDWAIWWNLWTDNNGWSSKMPWYRNGSFHPVDIFFGKARYSDETVEEREVLVPMPERTYRGTAKLQIASWKRARWPFAKRIRRVDIEMAKGEQIPHPGKGENSWDCGEDATFGLCGPARSIEDGIGNLVASVLTSRRKYGGTDWKPEPRQGGGDG
ncbi:MAG TPA: hypothetical protein VFU97_24345 [Xanthobacteraceae bacterium]|nr:hypothetical protein [Xanthobacteraceae bacterium]